MYEMSEDIRIIIRSRKSKNDRRWNSQKERGQKDKKWYTKHYTDYFTKKIFREILCDLCL